MVKAVEYTTRLRLFQDGAAMALLGKHLIAGNIKSRNLHSLILPAMARLDLNAETQDKYDSVSGIQRSN